MTLNGDSVISRNPQIISSKMDNEVVMMNIEKGNYYGLNRVGSEIWEKLAEPLTFGELCSMLLQEFEVAKEQCEKEVAAYLGKLVNEGLILVDNKSE